MGYMEYFPLPTEKWKFGGMDRYMYYHLYDFINVRGNVGSKLNFIALRFQRSLNLTRKYDYPFRLYGGSTYWSLTLDQLSYVINYTESDTKFKKRLRYVFCSEEIYFQTVLMNSIHANNIKCQNLRYIDWVSRRRGTPAYLDSSDIDECLQSEMIFARKFDDFSLVKLIGNRLDIISD